MAHQGAELLALVHAHPDVDDHRLVYADWLQANGDPRGEFIMLQFRAAAGQARAAELARERELAHTHSSAWLGSLAPALDPDSLVFRKGFLSAATVLEQDMAKLDVVRDAPEWSTVEKLAGPAEVLSWPALRSLWSVGPMPANTLVYLRRGEHCLAQITEARLTLGTWSPTWTAATYAVLPGLQRLELAYRDSYSASWNDFQPEMFASLLSAEQAPTLRSLLIRKHVLMPYRRWRDFTEPRPDVHAWAQLARRCANDVHSIRLEPCRGWRFTIERTDRDSPWVLVIDWHTASASADIKTLELAIGWVRRSDFAHVRVRIHDFARPQHQQRLRQVMTGIRPLAIELVGRIGRTTDSATALPE